MPVGGDFRTGDGEAVPPYFVYGKRIRRSRAEIYPCPSAEIFVPAMAKPCRHTLCMASGFDAAGAEITPTGGYIHMAKSLNTVPITLLHTGRCAMRSGVISAERDMVLSMSSSSASMAGTP